MKLPWIQHPRSKKPDTMLTFSTWALVSALFKFITNDVTLTVGDWSYNFGTVDAVLIGAIITPTLGAYVARKWKDSPDQASEELNEPLEKSDEQT